jgi:hypothetical protein
MPITNRHQQLRCANSMQNTDRCTIKHPHIRPTCITGPWWLLLLRQGCLLLATQLLQQIWLLRWLLLLLQLLLRWQLQHVLLC